MTTLDALNEEIGILRADAANMAAEIDRLTKALAAANADRDRLAQQLGMAQTEARGLRIELNRLGAPHAGYSYGDPLE